jgi:ACS family hexuronate transporter-like MFS transporter
MSILNAIAPSGTSKLHKVPGLRWWMIGMVFAATAINYIDRQCFALLAPQITRELNISNQQYGYIGVALLLSYAISQTLSGRMYDRIGARNGFAVSILVWSSAAIAHALAVGLRSLMALQSLLGLGEAGNWPGAAKVAAEWFPIRERALALAIFNSGVAFGGVVAPPLVVWLSFVAGWRATFVITGAIGFVWLLFWRPLYRLPADHPSITAEEEATIFAGQESRWGVTKQTAPIRQLLRCRAVWAILLARLFVDPVWWLFVIWLPKYLADARGFDMKAIGLSAWVPYLFAGLGSLTGGVVAARLIKRGWSVNRSRKSIIIAAACVMPVGVFIARVDSAVVALAFISIEMFAFQVWISNVQTLPSDYFSDKTVASVAGLGGTGAAVGSMVFILTTGWIVQHISYTPILTVAGVLAPLGTGLFLLLAGRIERLEMS